MSAAEKKRLEKERKKEQEKRDKQRAQQQRDEQKKDQQARDDIIQRQKRAIQELQNENEARQIRELEERQKIDNERRDREQALEARMHEMIAAERKKHAQELQAAKRLAEQDRTRRDVPKSGHFDAILDGDDSNDWPADSPGRGPSVSDPISPVKRGRSDEYERFNKRVKFSPTDDDEADDYQAFTKWRNQRRYSAPMPQQSFDDDPAKKLKKALKDDRRRELPTDPQDLVKFILLKKILKPKAMIMEFMELGLTEDGLNELIPNVMSKSKLRTVEMESYCRVIEREQELIERAEREPPQPKTDTEKLKLGHEAVVKPFTMDLPHGDEYNLTDQLHPAMLLRAPLANPLTLWVTLAQRFKEQKPPAIKSYTMDHINGMAAVSDRAWVAAHDYSITEFSVQHFMGPGLKALIKNQMKTAVDKIYRVEDGMAIMRMEADQFVEITRMHDFHNSFDKMCFVCRRAHPLDYSYESIKCFLSAEHHFEGMEHYQDRQGMQPAVLCVKMVDTIVYENRQAFVRDGETAVFHTQARVYIHINVIGTIHILPNTSKLLHENIAKYIGIYCILTLVKCHMTI